MNESTKLSDEMVATITKVKGIAEDGEEGDVSFVEVSCCPVVSLFITTGSTTTNGTNKKKRPFRV